MAWPNIFLTQIKFRSGYEIYFSTYSTKMKNDFDVNILLSFSLYFHTLFIFQLSAFKTEEHNFFYLKGYHILMYLRTYMAC